MYNIKDVRSQFPSLKIRDNGGKAVFLDAPGGTQTPKRVIDRITRYYIEENANTGGRFITSRRNDEMLLQAREAFSDFFRCSPEEVAFCHNATTISYKLSHALVRDMNPGDEVILTDLDHEANRGPWEVLAERGIVIRNVRVNPESLSLDYDHLESLLSEKTRIVAFNYASNAVGTISDAKRIISLAHDAGAITIADAVHYALHGVIDVSSLNVDFLYCSAYKFFGPHVGILYGKHECFERLRTLSVSAQKPVPPNKFETGTLNHEGIAGAAEAVEFLADLGRNCPDVMSPEDELSSNRRRNIVNGMSAIEQYEKPLAEYFKKELAQINGLHLYTPPDNIPSTSTISFRLRDKQPDTVSAHLARKGIFTWAGSFYVVQLMKTLGLSDKGGMSRIGLAPYNTKEEIDYTLEVLSDLSKTS